MRGHLVSHGQAAFWELLYKSHIIFHCRWHGPAPEPERCNSPTGASSYKPHMAFPPLSIVLKPWVIPDCMGQASGLPVAQYSCTPELCPTLCPTQTRQSFISPSVRGQNNFPAGKYSFRISLNTNCSELAGCNVPSFTLEIISHYTSY